MPPVKYSAFLAALILTACQQPHPPTAPLTNSDKELRDTVAMLARAHDQKTQLAFYESLPWKNAEAPYHAFYANMGKVQGELLKEIEAWAKSAKIDLKFTFTDDIAGRAQKIMETRQGGLVQSDGKADFTRDTLVQMYQDYDWQISLIQALQPSVKDPALTAYLQKSLKVHEDGLKELRGLLQRFQAQR